MALKVYKVQSVQPEKKGAEVKQEEMDHLVYKEHQA